MMRHDDATTVLLQDTMSCIGSATNPNRRRARRSLLTYVLQASVVTSSLIRFCFISVPLLLVDALGLLAFVIVLTPGFIRFAWYYWVQSVHCTVQYDEKSCRQRLDVYYAVPQQHRRRIPADDNAPSSTSSQERPLDHEGYDLHNDLRPVLVFFPGGGWVIGYKLWGALLARSLTQCGVTVVMADYRNYPWGTVPQQVQDVESVLQWTRSHIQSYGGNPKNIVVGGESAGGHLAFMGIWRIAQELKQQRQSRRQQQSPPPARQESPRSLDGLHGLQEHQQCAGEDDDLAATGIKGFVSLSAPYDLSGLQSVFHKHGFGGREIDRIFDGQLNQYDPCQLVVKERINCSGSSSSRDDGAVVKLPPVRIFHGSLDKTVPLQGSERFVQELKKLGCSVQFTMYRGWNHTHGNVEGPMDGDYRFHREVFEAIREWTQDTTIAWPTENEHEVLGRLCPHALVQLASSFMPI